MQQIYSFSLYCKIYIVDKTWVNTIILYIICLLSTSIKSKKIWCLDPGKNQNNFNISDFNVDMLGINYIMLIFVFSTPKVKLMLFCITLLTKW